MVYSLVPQIREETGELPQLQLIDKSVTLHVVAQGLSAGVDFLCAGLIGHTDRHVL